MLVSMGGSGRRAGARGKPAAEIAFVVLGLALVVLAAFCMPAARALAEPVSFPDLTDRVAGREDVSYADLVRLVEPGETGIRHIGGADWRGSGPEEARLLHFAAVPARSAGRDRLVLLLDFGAARNDGASGFVVLALFDIAGRPRLLDAADIAFDRTTSFAEPVRLPVGAGDLLVTQSTHFNSSQGYAIAALILLRGDRFELVDTIATLDDRACAYARTQRLDVRQGAGEPPSDIVATVTELTAASDENCGDAAVPQPATRAIKVTYRWDDAAQRYAPDSDAFLALARENEQRF